MRIVMVVGRSTGGIGAHVGDLTDQLCSLGHDVVIATDPLTARRFGWADAELCWPSSDAAASVRALRRLRELVSGADVVHAHGHQAAAVAVAALTGRHRPAFVVSQHNAVLGSGSHRIAADAASRLVARRAALVTGASDDLVAEARRLGARRTELAPVPSPRLAALLRQRPLGAAERRQAATTLLAGAGLDPSGPLVVTVSRIAPQKDLTTLVGAATVLSGEVTWVVVGDGDEELLTRLRARARSAGAPVHFVGAVPDPTPWLAAAEVFVLTSTWEARALVVQEAMAAGAPVVTTDTGGLPDLVADVGVLVPVGDTPGFVSGIRRFLDDEQTRSAAVTAGRELAGTWPDSAASARRWATWYSEVTAMT